MFTQAMLKTSDNVSSEVKEKASVLKEEAEEKGEDLKTDGKQALTILYGSDSKIESFFIYAQELFKSGAALVDGEGKLTTPLMEKMDASDFEGLTGEYIANFIIPSLMDGQ